MTQYELEVAINEVKTRYGAQVTEKMNIIRKNKLERIKHESEIMLIRASNCQLQCEVENISQRMNEELLPLLRQHAELRIQTGNANGSPRALH